MDNEFGKFLESLRGGLSLRKASERSGLSHTYIRDLELGVNRVTKTPIKATPETLKKLSEAYNYSYDDLMYRAGYIDGNEKESEYPLPEDVIINVIKEAEREYNVSLRDDPLVESAVRDLIHNLAKMKKEFRKND